MILPSETWGCEMSSRHRGRDRSAEARASEDRRSPGDKADAGTSGLAQSLLHLQATAGNAATTALLRGAQGRDARVVQRTYTPMKTTERTTLRTEVAGRVHESKKTGGSIDRDTELVVDPAVQDTTTSGAWKFRKSTTWSRATHIDPEHYDPNVHRAGGGFVRASKVAPVAYPRAAAQHVDIGSRGGFDLDVHWHQDIGEYAIFERSVENAARSVVYVPRVHTKWMALTPSNTLAALTPTELTQVNDTSRDDAAERRLKLILTDAANAGGIAPALLATQHNVDRLKHPLRLDAATGAQAAKDKWFTWSQNVFAKISQGANDVVASVLHWRTQIYPPDPTQAVVTAIEIEGSDLHDRGLGALFVTYQKPNDDVGMFPNVGSVRVVIKPEDRNIEHSLFGSQQGSLANQINKRLGLTPADELTTIKMARDPAMGTVIEFVQGTLARGMNNTGADTQAMSEAIAFTIITGMSDVHRDNVIWNNGKPYFIDADNSLNDSILGQPTRTQSGFSDYNAARQKTDLDVINQQKGAGSRSAIVQAMRADPGPIIQLITAAFTGKRGRVVPLATNTWANHFKGLFKYIEKDDGNPTDRMGTGQMTRWGIANEAARKVETGGPMGGLYVGPGLVGECGQAAAGNHFLPVLEGQLIKQDLDSGKVPFYEYEYSTGHVLHNGQVIWHGQTIADAMAKVTQRFV